MAIGKFARYVTYTGILLWFFPGQLKVAAEQNRPHDAPRPPPPPTTSWPPTTARCTTSRTWAPSSAGTAPPTCRRKGNDARAAAMAELAALMHRLRTEPQLGERIARAEQEPLTDTAARQPARDPARLAPRQRAARIAGAAPASWRPRAASTPGARSARPTTGPASSRTGSRCVALAREEADAAVAAAGLSTLRRADGPLRARHDAAQQVDRVFGAVRQWLPALIERVRRAPGAASR